MERRNELAVFHRCLNSDEGKMIMVELKRAWGTANPLDGDAATMGFNIGLLEAYRQLEEWQNGQGLVE